MTDYEYLDISGSTKTKRALADQFASVAKYILFPRTKGVELFIELTKHLNRQLGIMGDVLWEGDREFTVRLDSDLSYEEMGRTICHELVHVRQYCRKELSQPSGNIMVWKKTEYSTNEEYMSRPWEIEALKLEEEVYDKCVSIMSQKDFYDKVT